MYVFIFKQYFNLYYHLSQALSIITFKHLSLDKQEIMFPYIYFNLFLVRLNILFTFYLHILFSNFFSHIICQFVF